MTMPSDAAGHAICRWRVDVQIAAGLSRPQRTAIRCLGALALLAVLSWSLPGCGDSEFDQLLAAARGEDIEQQRLALRQLADMGPRAAAAVPDLILLCSDEDADVRRLAGLGLGNIAAEVRGDEAELDAADILSALSSQLEDENAGVRHSAAFALLGLNPDHQAAQDCLLVAMRRGDGGIVDRLKSMQPPPIWAVPTLIEILSRDRRPGIRRLAAVSLGEIAPDQADVRGALQQALRDGDDRVRDAAQQALQGERSGT
jgi:hypothetical protein